MGRWCAVSIADTPSFPSIDTVISQNPSNPPSSSRYNRARPLSWSGKLASPPHVSKAQRHLTVKTGWTVIRYGLDTSERKITATKLGESSYREGNVSMATHDSGQ